MRALMLAFALLCTCSVAYAAPDTGGLADADFTAKYFGTTAVLHASSQVVDPENWWGSTLPEEMIGNPAYLIGIVNSRRMDSNIEPLLDPNDFSLIVAGDEESDEHGWRYTINFGDMRPSEVDALISLLGGPSKVLKGASSVSYEPLKRRDFYLSTLESGKSVLNIGGRQVEIDPLAPLDEIKSTLADAFHRAFDQEVPFDMTLTVGSYMDGSRSFDLSVTADMGYVPGQSTQGDMYVD